MGKLHPPRSCIRRELYSLKQEKLQLVVKLQPNATSSCIGCNLKVSFLKLQPSTSCSLEGLQPSSVVHGQVAPTEKLHPPRVVLSQAGKVATSCEVATKCNFELQWLQLKVVLSQLKVVPHKVYVKKNHTYYGRTTYVWTLPSTADATERVSIKAPEARTSSASTSHSTLA